MLTNIIKTTTNICYNDIFYNNKLITRHTTRDCTGLTSAQGVVIKYIICIKII